MPTTRSRVRSAALLRPYAVAESLRILPTPFTALAAILPIGRRFSRYTGSKSAIPKKPFAFICPDLASITRFAQVSNFAFRILKRCLPGPYTFILETTRQTPEILTTKQKTVGIRIPDNRIALAIVSELGEPLVTTSVNLSGSNPLSDPYDIENEFGQKLDLVVDGGILLGDPSTVISLVGDRIEILRQGNGETSWITEG